MPPLAQQELFDCLIIFVSYDGARRVNEDATRLDQTGGFAKHFALNLDEVLDIIHGFHPAQVGVFARRAPSGTGWVKKHPIKRPAGISLKNRRKPEGGYKLEGQIFKGDFLEFVGRFKL